ncbi:hypothetical protein TGPRC2_269417 [Toxoplasma gondii TgCatPRC2]|uniref:Uncharacterized protein n=2 Tax=Toxoplasma gondii TaxID=5811 RepID=A0A151HNP0_TOXGO|nr:hypothetical protein TGARI_269417 [Toxoplasma gondii ARI]KYK70928.1 hypothetical protein TGPRC2_269417 [Toxoplasma gondii TgCatPRC2]
MKGMQEGKTRIVEIRPPVLLQPHVINAFWPPKMQDTKEFTGTGNGDEGCPLLATRCRRCVPARTETVGNASGDLLGCTARLCKSTLTRQQQFHFGDAQQRVKTSRFDGRLTFDSRHHVRK